MIVADSMSRFSRVSLRLTFRSFTIHHITTTVSLIYCYTLNPSLNSQWYITMHLSIQYFFSSISHNNLEVSSQVSVCSLWRRCWQFHHGNAAVRKAPIRFIRSSFGQGLVGIFKTFSTTLVKPADIRYSFQRNGSLPEIPTLSPMSKYI
jgi:hypothetical protein